MNAEQMVKNWDALGQKDPMWAILTDPSKADRKWNEPEFFESGRKTIEARLGYLRNFGINLCFGRALDFGCGLGRLTNALAERFQTVDGVDVSASMIEQAKAYCKNREKVRFLQNTRTDLADLETGAYDLVYSEIVLQHVPAQYQLSYIREFLRLLSPKGVAFFQTLHAVAWRRLAPNFVVEFYRTQRYRGQPFIAMYPLSPRRVKAVVRNAGFHLLNQRVALPEDASAGRFVVDFYLVSRTPWASASSDTARE